MTKAIRLSTPWPGFPAPGAAARLRRAAAWWAAGLALLPLAASACSGRLHVEVQDSGVYTLDYAAIVARQPSLKDCRSDELTLLHREVEVPIRIVGDHDGQFAAGARIEWVGRMLHGPQSWFDPYSTVNVYQLAAGPGRHLRMREIAPANAAPVALQRHLHLEQENLMIRLSDREMKPGDEPDVWQWAKLTPVDAQPFTWDFDLADIDARGSANAQLTLDFRGMSNVIAAKDRDKVPDHRIAVSINGKPLAAQTWDGRDEERRRIDVPVAWLREKDNRISIEVPQRDGPGGNFIVDVVMFNWFDVTYPARGDLPQASAFLAAADGSAELRYDGADVPQLYDVNGGYRRVAAAGKGVFRAAAERGTQTFTVTAGQFLQPTALRAVADVDLRAAAPGFDYVMVAHPRLIDAIAPLAQYHREHGHRVEVADVEAVYDEFNGGIAHPSAIRDLLAWGTRHWQVKPHWLLLVGDASFDIRHDVRSERLNSTSYALRPQPAREEIMQPGGLSNMPTTSYKQWAADLPNRNLIPTWQYPSAEGQAASDNGFATLTPDDYRPTIAVGRLPVVEPADVRAIVDKTLAYMTHPAAGDWRRDVTFVATDEVASFKQASDKIAADLGSQGYSIRSLYTTQDASQAQYANAQLKKDLDAGNLLVHFLGHGGAFIWRVGPPADLFTLDDVSRLSNADRYPMVLAMTCFSAPFDNPTEDSIGERFLRESRRGAVAVFAASWTNSPNPKNSKVLIDALLEPGNTIGDAVVAAKAKASDRAFVDMYNLLGDPAVVLARPRGQLQLVRGDDRWNPRVIVHVPERGFGGDVDVDWVDAAGKTLSSHHYEARDARFTLAVPSPAATQVRVHAANARSGYDAIGALSLAEPKPTEPAVAAKPAAPPRKPTAAQPPRPAPVRAAKRLAPGDRITERNFDDTRRSGAPAPGADPGGLNAAAFQ